MPGDSSIEWTEKTWNPVTGCSKVSPGCAHCYAESLTERFAGSNPGWIEEHRPWTPANAARNVRLRPERLDQPLRWTKPSMIFTNSMSDLFHEQIPRGFIAECFAVMGLASQHTFQVLTKRVDRMRDLLSDPLFPDEVWTHAQNRRLGEQLGATWPLPNVWLGVSIENRRFVDRADTLRETPAAVRFISAEPLLGPLLFDGTEERWSPVSDMRLNARCARWHDDLDAPQLDLTDIDWLIVGGESGRRHRPLDLQWVHDLRDATRCERCHGRAGRGEFSELRAGPTRTLWCPNCGFDGFRTAFFVKQLGGLRPGTELEDLPFDLRIRESPTIKEVAR